MSAHTYRLEREQRFRHPPEEIFRFFADVGNLLLITPDFLDISIQTPTPLELHAGTHLHCRLKFYGLPVSWRTRYEAFEAPHSFIDTLVEGPYPSWQHVHTFEATADGTVMRDVVSYTMPYGVLGRLAHALLIRRMLERIFNYRADALRQIYGDGTPRGSSARLGIRRVEAASRVAG